MDSPNLKKRHRASGAIPRRFVGLQRAFANTLERLHHADTLEERIDLTEQLRQITRQQSELLGTAGGSPSDNGLKASRKRK